MTVGRAALALPVVALLAGVTVVVTALGTEGASGATASGFPLAFGANGTGQLGLGTATTGEADAQAVALPPGVRADQIAAGFSHSVALGSDGVVYAWGANEHGQLGDGSTDPSLTPTRVDLPAGTTVTAVAAGNLDSFAVTATGQVYAWGDGELGELGNASTASQSAPVPVHLPAGVTVSTVSAGYGHVLALTPGGAVYAWGWNAAGQLGDGTGTNRLEPVKVKLPTGLVAASVSAGFGHSLASTTDGRVFAWGLTRTASWAPAI